jgi:hypothetical protein
MNSIHLFCAQLNSLRLLLYPQTAHVRVGKIIAFEKQSLVPVHGQRLSKAISKVEVSRMAAAASECSVGIASQLSMSSCNRFDLNFCFAQQLIKAPTQRWTVVAINNDGSFQPICR